MSIAICDGARVMGLFSDSADFNGFPTVDDGGALTVFTTSFTPSLVRGVSVEAGIPLRLLVSDGQAVSVDEAAYATALGAAIEDKLTALGAYGLARAKGGTTVNGFHYDTDTEAKSDLDSAYNLAGTASSPDPFHWWMSTGWHDIPKAQILADAPVVGAWYEGNFTALGVHFSAIAALTTLSAVVAYDYSTGWPEGT